MRKHLVFVLQTLGVLSQDGVMRFINIQTCKLLFNIGSHDDAITAATVSPNGRHIVTIMDNGSLNIYSVQCLTQDYNKVAIIRMIKKAVHLTRVLEFC